LPVYFLPVHYSKLLPFLLTLITSISQSFTQLITNSSSTASVTVGLVSVETLPSEQLLTMANQQLHTLNLTQRDIFQIRCIFCLNFDICK